MKKYLVWLACCIGLINSAQAQSIGVRTAVLSKPVQTCAQSAAFLARVSGFTQQDKARYSTAICALAATPTLAKLNALYVLDAPNQAASLLNLINTSFSITTVGGMIFGPNAGWQGNAVDGYLNTNYVPSTAAGNHYLLGASSLAVVITNPRQAFTPTSSYESINTSSSDFATFDGIVPLDASGGTNNSNATLQQSDGVAVTPGPAFANGVWVVTASGGATTNTNSFYKDNVLLGTGTETTTSTLPDQSVLIGALQCNICIGQFSGDSFAGAAIGGSLTSADVANLTNFFNAMAPTAPSGVAAAHWNFNTSSFAYNFATQGLTGIDVNYTLAPGFPFYNTGWFDCDPSPGNCGVASSNFVYSGGQVTLSNGAFLSTAANTVAAFTATVASTTMTVSSVQFGILAVGQVVAGNAALSGQTILSQLTGTTGSAGTYQLSATATIVSGAKLLGQSSVLGKLFPPGGYFEASISYPSGTTNRSFWLTDITCLYAQISDTGWGAAAHCGELDIFESAGVGNNPDMNAFDWTNINGGTGGSGFANFGTYNLVGQNFPVASNPASFHLYGMLWVPSTLNAGTGIIQFYLDRTPIGSQITYTSTAGSSPPGVPSNPNGNLFILESGNFPLMLQGATEGMNLQNVSVLH